MSIYNLLKQAILNKQQVIATCNGYYREMCRYNKVFVWKYEI